MLAINSISVAHDHQPDFDKLKEKGWTHPPDLREQPMLNCLAKEHGDLRVLIVQHEFRNRNHADEGYTEIFVHTKRDEGDENKVLLKGFGGWTGTFATCEALLWLDKELE